MFYSWTLWRPFVITPACTAWVSRFSIGNSIRSRARTTLLRREPNKISGSAVITNYRGGSCTYSLLLLGIINDNWGGLENRISIDPVSLGGPLRRNLQHG